MGKRLIIDDTMRRRIAQEAMTIGVKTAARKYGKSQRTISRWIKKFCTPQNPGRPKVPLAEIEEMLTNAQTDNEPSLVQVPWRISEASIHVIHPGYCHEHGRKPIYPDTVADGQGNTVAGWRCAMTTESGDRCSAVIGSGRREPFNLPITTPMQQCRFCMHPKSPEEMSERNEWDGCCLQCWFDDPRSIPPQHRRIHLKENLHITIGPDRDLIRLTIKELNINLLRSNEDQLTPTWCSIELTDEECKKFLRFASGVISYRCVVAWESNEDSFELEHNVSGNITFEAKSIQGHEQILQEFTMQEFVEVCGQIDRSCKLLASTKDRRT